MSSLYSNWKHNFRSSFASFAYFTGNISLPRDCTSSVVNVFMKIGNEASLVDIFKNWGIEREIWAFASFIHVLMDVSGC